MAAYLLILIITMFFFLYEIAGYNSNDSDGEISLIKGSSGSEQKGDDKGKIMRFIFSAVAFGLTFLVFIGQICSHFSSNNQIGKIKEDMKGKILTSLTAKRTNYCEYEKHGMKFIKLNDSVFTKKVCAKHLLKRITGLEYEGCIDTKFKNIQKGYGPLYQKINPEKASISYYNLIGQKRIEFTVSSQKNFA